jgi:hypothetical protein
VADNAICPRCRRLAPLVRPTRLDFEALTRLDLKPDEILAATVGWPDCAPVQLEMFGEYLTDWLDTHHMPVAGVLVLPHGSSMQAIAPVSAT